MVVPNISYGKLGQGWLHIALTSDLLTDSTLIPQVDNRVVARVKAKSGRHWLHVGAAMPCMHRLAGHAGTAEAKNKMLRPWSHLPTLLLQLWATPLSTWCTRQYSKMNFERNKLPYAQK